MRLLQWPQLVRPFVLTIIAFGLRPLYMMIGWALALAWTGNVSGAFYGALWLIDPLNLAFLVFSLFLGRTAWQSDREYHLLVPKEEQHASLRRTVGGRLCLGASLVFATLLAGYIAWAGFVTVSRFRLPMATNRKVAIATKHLNEGISQLATRPLEAEAAFRRAAPIWEEIVAANPGDGAYRLNLAITYQLLGGLRFHQGRISEARDDYSRAILLDEGLAARRGASLSRLQRAYVERNLALLRDLWPFVEIASLQQQAAQQRKAGDDRAAEATYRRAVALLEAKPARSPSASLSTANHDRVQGSILKGLAWLLATSTDPDIRKPAEAVSLAQKATELAPQERAAWNTLGMAYYRTADWERAVSAMETSMRLRSGGDSADWFILAMACWQRGDREQARRWYDRAAAWMQQNKPQDTDLHRFRAEAADLLGRPEPATAGHQGIEPDKAQRRARGR